MFRLHDRKVPHQVRVCVHHAHNSAIITEKLFAYFANTYANTLGNQLRWVMTGNPDGEIERVYPDDCPLLCLCVYVSMCVF